MIFLQYQRNKKTCFLISLLKGNEKLQKSIKNYSIYILCGTCYLWSLDAGHPWSNKIWSNKLKAITSVSGQIPALPEHSGDMRIDNHGHCWNLIQCSLLLLYDTKLLDKRKIQTEQGNVLFTHINHMNGCKSILSKFVSSIYMSQIHYFTFTVNIWQFSLNLISNKYSNNYFYITDTRMCL